MEVFTMKEFQENFEELVSRVENGEHIGIVDDRGRATVMVPVSDDVVRIHTEFNNDAP